MQNTNKKKPQAQNKVVHFYIHHIITTNTTIQLNFLHKTFTAY